MKKFLFKIFTFLIILIIISTFIWIFNYTNEPIIEIKEKILILGDSHTECAINDTIFTNSYNYSQSSEPFIYSYVKLINIASASKIDTLIISVSPVSIGGKGERLHIKTNKLLYRFPWEDLMFLFHHNPLAIGYSSNIFDIRANANNVGGYLYLDRFKLQKDLALRKTKTLDPCIPHEAQLLYLDKIVTYCRSKSIQLIFINTPMYHAERFYNMNNFYKVIEEKYNDVTFWDYGNYVLPDSCYGDVGHLNYIGAKEFSIMLQEKVRKKKFNL
ncbi:hypothetical protein EZS27_024668 [termite gut metagenome]|uniref:SGNH hydrolase-type esterase domain-containing protein n=1 Tax=termite gut metagenome TaxID=433724 RepID=A0A5J4QY28_9ZZZZ